MTASTPISGGMSVPQPSIPVLSPPGRTHDEDRLFIELVLFSVWRQKWLILAVLTIGLAISYFYISRLIPRYAAVVLLAIDTRRTEVVDIAAVISGLPVSPGMTETEVDILHSPELARRVAKKLDLVSDPEFAVWMKAPREPGWAEELWDQINPLGWGVWSWFAPSTTNAKADVSVDQTEAKQTFLIAMMLSRLTVETSDRSYTIRIRFESEDPYKAAAIANAFADEYLAMQIESKFEATARASAWLIVQVESLRGKVRESQEAVERYRESKGLFHAGGQGITTQQLADLNSQLVVAQTERVTKEARLRNLRELARGGNADSAPEVLASPLIQRLRERETDLRSRAGDLATTYGERHPLLVNVRTEMADLDNKIEEEVTRILTALTNEVEVAKHGEATLRARIAQIEGRIGQESLAEVRLGELQREAQANQNLFETFLSRYKETSTQTELQQPDARILSRARAPLEPSFPKVRGMMALSASGFLLLGVFLGLLRDRMEDGFRSGSQLESILSLPVLGVVPLVPRRLLRHEKPHEYMLRRPASTFSEAVRSVWATLNIQSDGKVRTILVTSSVPNEGKTTFAVALATAIARLGQQVVVIDCDFRRRTLTKLFPLQAEGNSIADVLLDRTTIEGLASKNPFLGLHFVSAGSASNVDPLRLLQSPKFAHVLERLRSIFDVVILDSPPLLAVSDGLIMAGVVDAVLLTVRWRTTRRELAVNAARQLTRSTSGQCVTVLTCADLSKYSRYGDADIGYYYSKDSKYYHN